MTSYRLHQHHRRRLRPDGSLYVLEIAQEGLLDETGAGGRLVRIDPAGDQTTVIDEAWTFRPR